MEYTYLYIMTHTINYIVNAQDNIPPEMPIVLYIMSGIMLIAILGFLSRRYWHRFYFPFGFPIYKRTIKVKFTYAIPKLVQIESAIPADPWPRFKFRTAAPNIITFHGISRHAGESRYTPIMNGTLIFDAKAKELTVIGEAVWYFALVIFIFIIMPIAIIGWEVLNGDFSAFSTDLFWLPIFATIILGGGFYIEKRRFDKVAEAAVRRWSRGKG